MRIIQYRDQGGNRKVGVISPDGNEARALTGVASVLELATLAIERKEPLAALTERLATGPDVHYGERLSAGAVIPPIDHTDPAQLLVTGTGLTHIGSAAARAKMHTDAKADDAPLSDSMKMFQLGIKGGKPRPGEIGVEPEWFYKGTGECIVAPGAPLPLPAYALSGAEEPEVVGIYLIDPGGRPRRIGWTLGNEFSDHTIESRNYLYTSVSKLRCCSIGPELLIGDLPQDVRGTSKVLRDGGVLWQDEVLLGEANMSHSFANLEHHHFKHPIFRRPGDLHAYFFGAAVLSHAAGIRTRPGDEFVIDVPAFGKPLRNKLEKAAADDGFVEVKPL
jgi:hypothetical protein